MAASKRKATLPPCVTGAPATVRADLEDGDVAAAAYTAQGAVLGALATVRRARTAPDADLLHAELCGFLVGMALRLKDQEARRPPGYVGGRPTGEQLRAAFDMALDRALGRAPGTSA